MIIKASEILNVHYSNFILVCGTILNTKHLQVCRLYQTHK